MFEYKKPNDKNIIFDFSGSYKEHKIKTDNYLIFVKDFNDGRIIIKVINIANGIIELILSTVELIPIEEYPTLICYHFKSND
jgi:hypothetical protein